MPGSKVRLRLFEDRLELYTPGMLPNTMTPDSLPYRQAARNEAITSLLARCPVEHRELASHRAILWINGVKACLLSLNAATPFPARHPITAWWTTVNCC